MGNPGRITVGAPGTIEDVLRSGSRDVRRPRPSLRATGGIMRDARKDVAAIAAVILLCGFAVVQTTFAQSEYETRQQELERPSNREQRDLGDERQRELE